MYLVYFFGAIASLFEGIGIIMFLPLFQSFDNSSITSELETPSQIDIILNDLIAWLQIENSMFSILSSISCCCSLKGVLLQSK